MSKVDEYKDWEAQIYNTPNYSIADASRYLKIPTSTLRSWLKGRQYHTKLGKKEFSSIIQRPDTKYSQLSFTNLVEAHVLRVIRREHKITLNKVRIALDYINQKFNTPHPLVQKRFKTDGVDLFIEQMEALVNVSHSGQLVMRKVLENLLNRIEWDEKDLAARLFPLIETYGGDSSAKYIAIDPNVSFGKPTIMSTGIPTEIITELYDAGDSIEEIAEDYNCTILQIEKAIFFESQLVAV